MFYYLQGDGYIGLLTDKCCSKTQRRNFNISKPYWNNELTQLWKVRVEKENLFLKCTGSSDAKRYCHQEFKLARRNFDKKMKYSERSFLKEQQKSIEKSAESGDFWKKLPGNSKKSKTILMKIKNPDGSVVY